MQSSAPELLDFSKESPATLDAYGVNQEKTRPFGTNCLLARRLVERGVRFVLLMHASWDHHSEINKELPKQTLATDQPAAALIKDLKQRGMLDDTLVVWGGELAEPRCVKYGVRRKRTMPGGIITRRASVCGWREEKSAAAR